MMRFLLTLFLFLNVLVSFAQLYNFRNWTLEHGLPQSKVTAIIQDNKRHLWIATRGGVSRFDGNSFSTFTKREDLSSNNVTSLFQDSHDQIWIGTADNGLTMFNGHSLVYYGVQTGLPGGGIASIAEDARGRIWVATASGLFYLNDTIFNRYNILPSQDYTSLLFEKDGTMWIGSKAGGLYRLQGDSVTRYTKENSHLPSNEVTALSLNESGKLWIGTASGVAVVEQNKLQPFLTDNSFVTGFAHDRSGNTWVAFKNDGLLRIKDNEITRITKENGLRTNNIVSIFADVENNIWIGTNGYGLQQYRAPWFLHYFTLGQEEEPHITTIAKDKNGSLWAGTDNGLVVYETQGSFKQFKKKWPPGTSIYSLLVRDISTMWVGTSQGAWHIADGKNKQYTVADGLPSDEVRAIKEDAQGNLWFATANGIARYQNGSFKSLQPEHDFPGRVFVIFVDSKDQVWFGAENGVYTWLNGKLTKVKKLEEQSLKDVTSIAEDAVGTLYFGGFNYGLLVYNPGTEETTLYSTAESLPNDDVKSLFVDGEHLWVGTNNNVLKVSLPQLRQQEKLVYTRYNGQNGFMGLEVCHSCITRSNDSTIWFGTAKGLTAYLPALVNQNNVYPALFLSGIRLFMRPVNWEELGYKQGSSIRLPQNLKLPFNRNHITIDYKAIWLTNPASVRYKYKLAGYEDNWSEITDQSFVTYADLEPGSYSFQVIASNNNGYWTPKPAIYNFSVNAPLWQREWFMGLLLLVISGAILSVIRLRERGLKEMNTLLDLRVQHRTRLLERKHLEKEMLLKEIHHRVKNNLQIVMSLLNLQARHVRDPQAQEAMQAIRSRVRSMSLLHERLYQLNNLAHINLENYIKEICESLYESFGVTKNVIALTLRIPPIQIDIDSAITLGLIVNELISNALKYAFVQGQGGQLTIIIEQKNRNDYILIVEDNGIGIPHAVGNQENKPFGLNLVAALSKKLDGKIHFENNNGTKVILYFVLPS